MLNKSKHKEESRQKPQLFFCKVRKTLLLLFLFNISRSFSIVVLIPLMIAGMNPASSRATTPTVVPPGEETWSTSSHGFYHLKGIFDKNP